MKEINNIKNGSLHLLFFLALFLFAGCSEKQWDEHYLQSDVRLNSNLLEEIQGDPELSTFSTYLTQTGYDTLLSVPGAYTVWAPLNVAFEGISPDTLNNPVLLKALIGNHISRFSYNANSAMDSVFIKMLNGKYSEFYSANGSLWLGETEVVEKDLLCNNGIVHTIGGLARYRENIWEYFRISDQFPGANEYLAQFDTYVFDQANSVQIGKNTLGQPIYDTVYKYYNTYFDIVGNLTGEEERFTYLGLTDGAYAGAYERLKDYYAHPDGEVTLNNTNNAIYNNLNFYEFNPGDMDGSSVTTTTGNAIAFDAGWISESMKLSNGSLLIAEELGYEPGEIIYFPVRYEVENTDGRVIGNVNDLTIQKVYDVSASNEFINIVELKANPDDEETNNYFEISFSNVLSAAYNIYIKFAPAGAIKDTKLRFVFSYVDNPDGGGTKEVVHEIPAKVVGAFENGLIKIGGTYSIPVYVGSAKSNPYYVKLKVIIDVSEAELVLFDRKFGIDYIELVPAE